MLKVRGAVIVVERVPGTDAKEWKPGWVGMKSES